ncbi:MAG: hypothetical protein ABIB65_05905 [Candidatus Margulisiibacteriota bacterium]
MSISFNAIKNQGQLFAYIKAKDKDKDGKISTKEDPSTSKLQAFDQNKNGKLDLCELMQAVNHTNSPSVFAPIFKDKEIGSCDLAAMERLCQEHKIGKDDRAELKLFLEAQKDAGKPLGQEDLAWLMGMSKKCPEFWELISSVDALLQKGFSLEQAKELFNSIFELKESRNSGFFPYIYELVDSIMEPGDLQKGKNSILTLARLSGGQLLSFINLRDEIGLDLKKCSSPDAFKRELASRVNDFANKTTDSDALARTFTTIGKAMANIWAVPHFRFFKLYKSICADLSPRAVYGLLAMNRENLYDTNFAFLAARVGPLSKAISTLDPERGLAREIVLTYSSFGRLETFYKQDPKMCLHIVEQLIQENDYNSLFNNIATLAPELEKMLSGGKAPEVGKMLLQTYSTAPARNRMLIGFLIKRNIDSFSGANKKAAEKAVAGLPDLPEPKVPGQWLKAKEVNVKQYFYEKESYDKSAAYFKNHGFTSEPNPPKWANCSKQEDILVLSRKLKNGKLQRIVLVRSNNEGANNTADVEESMRSGRFAILSHRGHNFELPNTFSAKEGIETSNQTLIYLGSCRSANNLPGVARNYPGQSYIADRNTGYGDINNAVIGKLLDFIGGASEDKEYSWNDAAKQVGEKLIKGERLVFPGSDPLSMLISYTQAIAQPGPQQASQPRITPQIF